MSEAGLVTIIIPNRNHAHYLPRALDAMLAQTWTKLEIIVVDDASSDSSCSVVVDYEKRDPRVRLVALNEHHGINRAVNTALASTRGEFVHIAGADDFVEPIFVERCVAEMNRNPGVGLSFSDPTEFHEHGQRVIRFPLYLNDCPIYYDRATLIDLLKRNYFHISANTGLYRTIAFREAGGYRPELLWLCDWFATLVIALRHGACFLPEQLTYLTIRSDSYSGRSLRDAKAQRPLLEQVLRLLASPGYSDIAPTMRSAGLIPEDQLRTLYWLLASSEGRKFIRPHLIGRVFGRHIWSVFRPLVPPHLRRRLRQMQSERARVA
jgi:glycosyltransferase involved in cell wall biosynthesis